jgi:hypothetical protein
VFVPVTHVVSAVIGEACPGQLYWRGGCLDVSGDSWVAVQPGWPRTSKCIRCTVSFVRVRRAGGRDRVSVKQDVEPAVDT